MKINSLLLPHPVLGRGDDVLGEFKLSDDEFSIQQDDLITKLSILLILKNQSLESLISSKAASFNIEVECPATFFRKSYSFSQNKCVVNIDKNSLRGKVIVSFYITSNATMPNYQNTSANEDYGSTSFEISVGDVLAYAGTEVFDANVLWEDLRRIFNIMKIRKDAEREEGPVFIDLNGHIIFISLSKRDYLSYELYKEENDNFTHLYHASLVLSALTYALGEMMSERKEEYREWKWYQVLDSQKIIKKEILPIWETSNIPEIAQLLLGEPIKRMLSSIENISTGY